MDVNLAMIFIDETRKSLVKLLAAEENFNSRKNKGDEDILPISDPEYMEAEHEVKLFVKQLETLTGVSFNLTGSEFLVASLAAKHIEPNLKAIEQLIQVLSRQQDSPGHSKHP